MGKSSTTTTSSNNIESNFNNTNNELFRNYQNAVNNQQFVERPMPLGFNPTQTEANDRLLQIGRSGPDPYLTGAGDIYNKLGNYNPMMVSSSPIDSVSATAQGYDPSLVNRGDIRNVSFDPVAAARAQAAQVDRGYVGDVYAQNANAAQMTAEGLKNYVAMMDPTYQNAVLGQAQNDIERQRQMTQNAGAAAAAAAGAFGGSRHGVADAETNRAYGDTFARTAADLRLQGYQQALGNYQQDLGRQQQVGMFNSDAALRAGMANQGTRAQLAGMDAEMAQQANLTNAQLQQQAGIANSQGRLQAGLANQGMDASTAFQNAGFKNDASRFGADAQNNVSQFNAGLAQNRNIFNSSQNLQAQGMNQSADLAGAGIRGNAAGGLLNVGNSLYSQNLSKAGLIQSVGDRQYALDSDRQQTQYENDQGRQNFPVYQAQSIFGAHNQMPYGTTNTSTTVTRPSLMSMIGQGIGMASNFIPGVGAFGGMTRGLLGMGGGGNGMSNLPMTSVMGGSGFDPMGSRLNRYMPGPQGNSGYDMNPGYSGGYGSLPPGSSGYMGSRYNNQDPNIFY
jgi:hypothetical protein